MEKIPDSITLTRIYYKREVVEDNDLSYETKSVKRFYRGRKRIYFKDIIAIEEYKYGEFDGFSDTPKTHIEYAGGHFVAEIDFEVLSNILDEYDKNRTLIINN